MDDLTQTQRFFEKFQEQLHKIEKSDEVGRELVYLNAYLEHDLMAKLQPLLDKLKRNSECGRPN